MKRRRAWRRRLREALSPPRAIPNPLDGLPSAPALAETERNFIGPIKRPL